MTDLISREAAIAAAESCPDSHWGPWVAERLRALPAVQPDAAEIREAALREAIAFAKGTLGHWLACRAGDNRAFTVIKGINALIDKPGKEAALREMARLGQEFDAAIFSDVEGLYENGEPGKEVVQPEKQSINPNIREPDTAPAGLSAGGGAGWQPIETAPKDRVVDLWSSRGFRYPDALWDVCWGEKCWTNPHNHVSIEEGGPYTHWRYPPEPPATEGI